MSKHLKRYFTPKTWEIKKKGIKYVSKPSPGTHKLARSMPLNVILRDLLDYASTSKEVKYILNNKRILVDGIRRTNYRSPAGLFDVISLPDVNEHFRIIINNKGKLKVIKIGKNESDVKPCKITGKKVVRGKVQLNLYDGKNILVEKDSYKVGDVILVKFGDKKIEIKDHIKLDKNTLIFLTGGKNIGHLGTIQDTLGNRIIYKTKEGKIFETLKNYAFPLGKEKSVIKLE